MKRFCIRQVGPSQDKSVDPLYPCLILNTLLCRIYKAKHWIAAVFFLFVTLAITDAFASYYDPGFSDYREAATAKNTATNVDYVDPFLGQLKIRQLDLSIPGNGGLDINVWRFYDSNNVGGPIWPTGIGFGAGWSVNFGHLVNACLYGVVANGRPIFDLGDGTVVKFSVAPDGSTFISKDGWRGTCVTGYGSGMIITSPKGIQYQMTVPSGGEWLTQKITDPHGNWINFLYGVKSLGYNPYQYVTQITANDGRLVTFQYNNGDQYGQRKLKVMAFNGQNWNYSYAAFDGKSETNTQSYSLSQVTRPDGLSWQYSYPTIPGYNVFLPMNGYLGKITEPNGATISYSYGYLYWDGGLTALRITSRSLWNPTSSGANPPGQVWTYSYALEPTDLLANVIDPLGGVTTYKFGMPYSNAWQIGLMLDKLECNPASGQTTCLPANAINREQDSWTTQSLSYDSFFVVLGSSYFIDPATYRPLLAQKTITRNGATYTTQYGSYDSYGNPGTLTETGPNGGARTTTLTYYVNTALWIVNQLQNETYPGSSVTRAFNSFGDLSSITRDGVTTSHTYDSQGNVTSTTFPRTLIHNYTNYKRGIPQNESQPEGISLVRVVDDAGNVTSIMNGEGYRTTYSYDGLSRVKSIGYPIGSGAVFTYGGSSNTGTYFFPATKQITRGNLSEVTTYDGVGQPVSVSLGGITRIYQYDSLGRKTFESNPASTVGTTYSYDILDRITKITFADGKYRSFAYAAGKVTETDENNKPIAYIYRSYGSPLQRFLMGITAADASANVSIVRNTKDLITSVTQGGITRNYGYNSSYYLTSIINPETGTTLFGRDPAGNMTTRNIGSSGRTTFSYDGQNRLSGITYPGDNNVVTFAYTKNNKLSGTSSPAVQHTYHYDANDNLINEQVISGTTPLLTTYTYSDKDQLATITYPVSANVVNFAPDALGRPTMVSGYISSVAYWPSGQIQKINYANGTVSNYGQNARLWPSSFNTAKGATSYINSAYGYDGVGNLTSISDTVDPNYNRTVGYDNINRLISVISPSSNGTFTYDGVGNLRSQVWGGGSLTYGYDATNRLTSLSGYRSGTVTYDAYGNVQSSPAGNTYSYDDVPNLRSVSNGAGAVSYAYDGSNHRATVTKFGVTTYEDYDPNGNLLIEYTPGQTNKLVEYMYLGGKRIAQRVSNP